MSFVCVSVVAALCCEIKSIYKCEIQGPKLKMLKLVSE